MRTSASLNVALVLWAAVVLVDLAPAAEVSRKASPEWKTIDAKQFTFQVSSDVQMVPVRGIDSLVGTYRSDRLELNFDYGSYSDPLDYSHRLRYERHTTTVDGFDCYIVTIHDPSPSVEFPEVIAIHFPDVSPGKQRYKSSLTMYARCLARDDYVTIRRVFASIQFAPRRAVNASN